jgi:hypothetical protein
MNADVISYSWMASNISTSNISRLMIKEFLDHGTVIVRAAGNTQGISDDDMHPFAHDVDERIIIVSGTDKNDNHTNPNGGDTQANFSEVDICSPGYGVMGAHRYDNGTNTWPYYGEYGGDFLFNSHCFRCLRPAQES